MNGASAVQGTTGAVAAASAAGAWLSIVKAWVLELFGVPLPVVLAAATGAFGARSFLPSGGLWRAFSGSLAWTFIGAFGADGIRAVSASFGVELPPAGAPFAALALAGLGQLLLTKGLIEKARAAVGKRVETWGNKGGE